MVSRVRRVTTSRSRHKLRGKPKNIVKKRNIHSKLSRVYRSQRIRPVLFILLFTLVAGVIYLFLTRAATTEVFQSEQSGLYGAGFQNVIAIDPTPEPGQPPVVISGADVSGFHRSTDYGQTWKTSNGGFTDRRQREIATVVFSNKYNNVVYAGFGAGRDGGLLISRDNGLSWGMQSATVAFHAGNDDVEKHPRATGNLLALDENNGRMYAATFSGGVKRLNWDSSRAPQNGDRWTSLGEGLNGVRLRTIVIDPSDNTKLFVGTDEPGPSAYRIDNAAGTNPVITRLANAPTDAAEEMIFIDNILYSVGPAGVYKVTNDGATWTKLAGGLPSNIKWESIDGYKDVSSQAVIIVGCVGPVDQKCIMRSTDGGNTWQPIDAADKVHTTVGNSSGRPWWLFTSHHPEHMLSKPQYVAAYVKIGGPGDRNRIFVAGRAGVWGTSSASLDWYPLVKGLGVTINRSVGVDPTRPGRVYVANTDWVFLASADHLKDGSIVQNKPGANTGNAIAFESNTGKVYFAAGHRDHNEDGEIYSNPNPSNGSSNWSPEGLRASEAGGKRPLGMIVGKTAANETVILAAVENSGIWRKVGGGNWTHVNSSAMSETVGGNTINGSFSWPSNTANQYSQHVYLYDRKTGVWHSDNYGVNWTKIWGQTIEDRLIDSGFVAATYGNPTSVYVAVKDGLFKIANRGAPQAVNIGGAKPGPMAVGPNNTIYLATRADNGQQPGLFRSSDGSSWQNVADAFYINSAGFPLDIDIGSDNYVYTSTRGNGVIVTRPTACTSSCNNDTVPSVSITAPTSNENVKGSVNITATADDDGTVTKVDFYVDNVWKGTDNAPPYSYSWDTQTVSNGTHTLKATAYDNINQTGNSTLSITVANNAPPTVGITSPANGATVEGSVNFAANAADDSRITKVEFFVDGTIKSTDSTSPYEFSLDTAALPNKAYALTAKAYDNGSPALLTTSNPITITVANDVTPPTVSVSAPLNNATVEGSVNVNANANDDRAVTKVEFYVGTTLVNTDSTPPYSFNWNTLPLNNGSYTLTAKAYDNASPAHSATSAAVNVIVSNDVTSPVVSITSPLNNATINEGSVNVTANASDDRTVTKVELYVDGTLKSTDSAPPYIFSWDAKAGDHSLTAKAYDAAGHVTTSPAISVHVNTPDTTAPVVSLTAPTSGAEISGPAVTISANATDNVGVASVEFMIDGETKASDSTSPYSFSWDSNSLADGTHTITAKAYDAARNSTTSSAINVTIKNDIPPKTDDAPPTVSITAPTASATVVGTANITADAADNVGVARVEIYVDGNLSADPDVAAPYVFGWDSTGVPNGSHTIYAIAYDAAGNSKTSSTVTVVVDNPVEPGPKAGDANGDNKVDIYDAAIVSHPNNWGQDVEPGTRGDLNSDGIVNIFDAAIVSNPNNWGH